MTETRHTYSVHLAGNLAAPENSTSTVQLDDSELASHLTLGAALRQAGVLPRGRALRSVVLGRHDLTAFPRSRDALPIELKRTDLWTVIGRGLAGWHAARPNVSSSGGTLEDISGESGPYDGPKRPWTRAGYLAEAAEGARVYDASEADPAAFTRHVMAGPMFGVGLPDDAVDSFGPADQKAAEDMLPGLSGGFETLAAHGIASAQARKYSSLDRVGWSIYRGLLEAVGGVRFGVVRAGKVVWET